MRRAFALIAFAAALPLGAGAVLAASQGNLGSTSSGTLDISLVVPQLVRISYLDDINLGTFNGTSGLSGSDDICVWSSTRAYQVTASGDGAGGDFVLTGAANGDILNYTVQWADSSGAASGAALGANTPLAGQATAQNSPTCQGGSVLTASVIVDIAPAAMTGVSADSYSGTLTLLVEPE